MAYDPWVVQPRKKKPGIQWTRATSGTGSMVSSPFLDQLRGRTSAPASPRGGSNPYAGLLQDYMNQARADFGADTAADRGSMINALRKYAISYGALPDFSSLGGLGGEAAGYFAEALDPNTRALAEKAEKEGLSSHARLAHANQLTTRRIPAALAARGILRSGQTGSDLAEQALTYKQQGYDMLNELLGGITGTVGNFQEAERQRQRQLAQMEMEAAWRAAQDWGDSDLEDGGAAASSPAAQVAAIASGGRRGGGFPITSSGLLSRTNPRRQRNYLNARMKAGRM